MKKALKIIGIIFGLFFVLGILAVVFETPEQRAEREAKMAQDKAKYEAEENAKQAELQAKKQVELEDKAKKEAEEKATKAKEQAEKEAKAVEEAAKAKEQAEQERADELKRIEIELMTLCQMDIQKDLHNEKSMKIDHWTFKSWETDEGKYRVGFKFNASNLYGAEVTHTAVCEFDQDKKLLRREVG